MIRLDKLEHLDCVKENDGWKSDTMTKTKWLSLRISRKMEIEEKVK